MDLGLTEKRALLIGAGRGLGGAAAISLAREHARLAVVARTREDVEARARECLAAGAPDAIGIAADATDPAQLDAAIQSAASRFGGIDILVTLVVARSRGDRGAVRTGLASGLRAQSLARGWRQPLRAAVPGPGRGPARLSEKPREASVILHVASIWGARAVERSATTRPRRP